METLTSILFVLVITVLFAIGGKITFYFKNREIALMKESYEKDLNSLRQKLDSEKAEINTGWYKNLKQMEGSYQAKLDEKDQVIVQLNEELEQMKQWKNDLTLRIAEAGGDTQNIVFKLINLNLKLEQQRNANWRKIEQHLNEELQGTLGKVKTLFAEAESTHTTGLEVINIYETHLPDDVRKKVQRELSSSSSSDRKSLPER